MGRGRPRNITGVLSKSHHYTKAEKEEIARRADISSSMASKSSLEAPNWISNESKIIFDDFMKDYKKLDASILSDIDMNALTMYCDCLAEYRYYKKTLPAMRKNFDVLKEKIEDQLAEEDDKDWLTAMKTENAAIASIQKAEFNMQNQQKLFMDLTTKLGLTPEARSRLLTSKDEKNKEAQDPALAWISKINKREDKKA